MISPELATLTRLNLGCGYDRREGYLNVDFQEFHSPDLVADVRDLSALPAGHFEEIVAYDVLEHLPRLETDRALREWHRLLRPGGVLRLRVPDVLGIMRLMAAEETAANHRTYVQHLFGTQAYTGDFHQTSFTDVMIATHLLETGYSGVEIEARDGWLLDVVAERPDGARAPLALSWRSGFYNGETVGDHTWHWCHERCELLVVNGQPGRPPVFTGLAHAGSRSTLHLDAGGRQHRLKLDTSPRPIRVELPADEVLRLTLRCDAKPVRAENDPRHLVLALQDAALEA